MRHHSFSALCRILAASLALAAPARAAADDVAKGGELAHALCAQCHLNEGQGEKQGSMGTFPVSSRWRTAPARRSTASSSGSSPCRR